MRIFQNPMRSSGPVTIHGRHTILDYIFFTRPVLMPPVWTIALLGAHGVASPSPIPIWRWIVMFVQLWCLFGAVYTLNQIFDVESDRANNKLFFLPESLIRKRAAWIFTVALNLASLALALLFGIAYLSLSGAIVLLGVLYSAGPRAWKNHHLLGLLANVVAHGLIVYSMGAVFAGGQLSITWGFALPYVFAVGGVYLATAAADTTGDSATGKRTVAVAWGTVRTMIAAFTFIVFALILSVVRFDWHLAAAAVACLPFFAISVSVGLLSGSPALQALGAPQTSAKAAVAALTLAAIVAYPFYLACLVPGFLLTRAFFHWRFRMTYPSLTPGR
ncbi:MAG: UbiA family prenyltransferase [candidate division Zixibacteria bacterium]|nr:UbiA family prenyltransferase [candidate division Zixibacteria bacterium]